MSNIVSMDKNVSAGKRAAAIVPSNMSEVSMLAQTICRSGLAPKGLDTPDRAMVAILHGLEIGMSPMAAMQRIAIVGNRPTIFGDAAIGLVRASGLAEYIKETIEGEGDNRVAVCAAKRRGEPEPIVRRFSVADAKKAGLWGKSGPWQQFSERMLQMRARAFALRDGFADVLGGLYLKEEIEDDTPRQETRQIEHQPEVIDGVFEEDAPVEMTISDEQRETLEDYIKQTESDTRAFCKRVKVARLADLPASDYDTALSLLEQKAARMAAQKGPDHA